MYHHDSREYQVSASEAAKRGREKMEAIIAKGRASAIAVVEQVQSQVPQDRIAPANRLTIGSGGDKYTLKIPETDAQFIHEHAIGQVAQKTNMPAKFLDDLSDKPWGRELVAHNLNTLLAHSTSRHLIRSVNSEVRGFVSDRFRRLDSRPLLDAFILACKEIGALPIEGYALDTKVRMRAVLPMVFEPAPNEVMLFGLEWGNSDFGDGGHCVRLWNQRIWCTNLAIIDEALRQVHLGKRLDDNITYSDRTYRLDNEANASALRDVVYESLSPVKVNQYLTYIKEAAEQKVGEKDVARILKAKLQKSEAEQVEAMFNGPDVLNLPEGKSTYRLSNAVSWFAQTEGLSANRKLELQKIAGDLLPGQHTKAREV